MTDTTDSTLEKPKNTSTKADPAVTKKNVATSQHTPMMHGF